MVAELNSYWLLGVLLVISSAAVWGCVLLNQLLGSSFDHVDEKELYPAPWGLPSKSE